MALNLPVTSSHHQTLVLSRPLLALNYQSPSYIITSPNHQSDFGFVKNIWTRSVWELFCVLWNIDFVWRCLPIETSLQSHHQFTIFRTAQIGLNPLFTVTIVVILLTLISSVIIFIDMAKGHIIHKYSALCALLVPTPLLVGRSALDFLVCAFHASSPGW